MCLVNVLLRGSLVRKGPSIPRFFISVSANTVQRISDISNMRWPIKLKQEKCKGITTSFRLFQFQHNKTSHICDIWCSLNRVRRHADEKSLKFKLHHPATATLKPWREKFATRITAEKVRASGFIPRRRSWIFLRGIYLHTFTVIKITLPSLTVQFCEAYISGSQKVRELSCMHIIATLFLYIAMFIWSQAWSGGYSV